METSTILISSQYIIIVINLSFYQYDKMMYHHFCEFKVGVKFPKVVFMKAGVIYLHIYLLLEKDSV